jgi:hypothetical protein
MKIVVFGPERRTGALVGERIIDLNHGMAHTYVNAAKLNPKNKRRYGYRRGCYRLLSAPPQVWKTHSE